MTMGKGDDSEKEKKEASLPVRAYLVLYNLAAAAGYVWGPLLTL